MRFVEVPAIPKYHTNCEKKDLRGLLDEFIKADIKYAQIILEAGDYSDPTYAQVSIKQTIKRYGHPAKAVISRGVLYLERIDFDE